MKSTYNSIRFNNSNDAIKANKVKKIEKRRQIHFLEYKSLCSQKEQNNLSEINTNNNLLKLKTYNMPNIFNQDENTFLFGKMKVFKLNNNTNYQQIKSPKRNISSNSNININKNGKMLIKSKNINENSNGNINNLSRKNKFLNDISSINLKKKYIINKNEKFYLKAKNDIYRNHQFSPDIIKTKNKLNYRLNIGSPDPKRLVSEYRSTSNKFKRKKRINYNSNYTEDLEKFGHTPININNINSNKNVFSGRKCYNRVDI